MKNKRYCPCMDCGKETIDNFYWVNSNTWHSVVPNDGEYDDNGVFHGSGTYTSKFLCINCFEKRLGRKLTKNDFTEIKEIRAIQRKNRQLWIANHPDE